MSLDFKTLLQELKSQIAKLETQIEDLKSQRSSLVETFEEKVKGLPEKVKADLRGYQPKDTSSNFEIKVEDYDQDLEALATQILNTRLGL